MDQMGKQLDVKCAVNAVEQRSTDEVKRRAEKRKEQIAQSSLQSFRSAVEADQGDSRECQKLQCDVKGENIPGQKHRIQRAPYGQKQDPECEWGPRFG